jgi:hypothetical protein
MPIKIAMSASARKLVAFFGAIFLLLGIATLGLTSALHAYAPLAVLLGSFSLGLAALDNLSMT